MCLWGGGLINKFIFSGFKIAEMISLIYFFSPLMYCCTVGQYAHEVLHYLTCNLHNTCKMRSLGAGGDGVLFWWKLWWGGETYIAF